MDGQSVNTHYDYVAVFIIYVVALLFMYALKGFMTLFQHSRELSRFITGTITLLGCTLLYVTRSVWLPQIPVGLDKVLILQAVGTIWWFALGYSVVHFLESFVWSGMFTQEGQLVVPKILTDLIRIFISATCAVFMLYYVYSQPIAGVLATSGVLAIVIGYSAQSSLSHIFAGLALNLNPSFSKGDYVEIDGRWGRIIDMSWRYVTLQDWEENYLTIPNSVVASATIKNFMHPTSRRGVVLYVTVPHNIPPAPVKEALLQATKASPDVLEVDGGPWVTLWEFTEYGARYQIYFYTTLAFNYTVRDDVFSAIWYTLRRYGIPLAITRNEIIVQRPAVTEPLDHTALILKLLKNIPLFDALRDAELQVIAEESHRLVYGPPECVIRQNEIGSSVFIVESGLLDVYVQQSDQSSLKVAQIGPGSIFGEMALLTGEPRAATIRAATETSVYEISKQTLQPILAHRPELIEELSELLAARQLDDEMKSSAYQSERAVPQTAVHSVALRIAARIRAFFYADDANA